MSVLINGSPTEKINIQRGVEQKDPLASFFFLLVAKDFSGLMRNTMSHNLFKGFGFRREGLVISHLQYADDALSIGMTTIDNL